MAECYTCELVARRDRGGVPLWDAIQRTVCWDVVHSYNTSLAGWTVLVLRRHAAAIDELSVEEALELGRLIRDVSAALKQITACVKTYVMQFAEAAEHQHVHFHIVPRMSDQPAERKAMGIFGYLGVAEEQRVSEATMNEIARRMRQLLSSSE